MLDYGRTTSLPARYRIALAISLALFLHTAGLSAIPSLLERTEQPTPTMTVTLVAPGSQPAPEAAASSGEKPAEQPQEPRDASVPQQDSKTAHPDQPEAPSQSATPRVTPAPEPASAAPAAGASQAEAANQSPPSLTAAAGAAATSPTETPRQIRQVTESPKKTDAYVVSLATRIARELRRNGVSMLRELSSPVTLEVELHLLGNGALTRANVSRSSGVKGIDGAAYRAALAASPYPEPPGKEEGQQRYRVELVFSPERLEN
ncbi:TonB family protein [Marinobacter sp. GN3S48]|uniref:TonB family protein n=1 Tax=Marinobacter sp. GN3S48 TaxID=3382302 RepID=UPI00387B184C